MCVRGSLFSLGLFEFRNFDCAYFLHDPAERCFVRSGERCFRHSPAVTQLLQVSSNLFLVANRNPASNRSSILQNKRLALFVLPEKNGVQVIQAFERDSELPDEDSNVCDGVRCVDKPRSDDTNNRQESRNRSPDCGSQSRENAYKKTLHS